VARPRANAKRESNLAALDQCEPVFVTLTGPCPWEISQLNFPAP